MIIQWKPKMAKYSNIKNIGVSCKSLKDLAIQSDSKQHCCLLVAFMLAHASMASWFTCYQNLSYLQDILAKNMVLPFCLKLDCRIFSRVTVWRHVVFSSFFLFFYCTFECVATMASIRLGLSGIPSYHEWLH